MFSTGFNSKSDTNISAAFHRELTSRVSGGNSNRQARQTARRRAILEKQRAAATRLAVPKTARSNSNKRASTSRSNASSFPAAVKAPPLRVATQRSARSRQPAASPTRLRSNPTIRDIREEKARRTRRAERAERADENQGDAERRRAAQSSALRQKREEAEDTLGMLPRIATAKRNRSGMGLAKALRTRRMSSSRSQAYTTRPSTSATALSSMSLASYANEMPRGTHQLLVGKLDTLSSQMDKAAVLRDLDNMRDMHREILNDPASTPAMRKRIMAEMMKLEALEMAMQKAEVLTAAVEAITSRPTTGAISSAILGGRVSSQLLSEVQSLSTKRTARSVSSNW